MTNITFRAGRMQLNGSQLVADARRGLVQLVQVCIVSWKQRCARVACLLC